MFGAIFGIVVFGVSALLWVPVVNAQCLSPLQNYAVVFLASVASGIIGGQASALYYTATRGRGG